MLAANPALTVSEVRELLRTTALDWGADGPDSDYGWGRMDAYAAIKAAGSYGSGTGPAVPGHVTFAGSLSGSTTSAEHLFTVTDTSYPIVVTLIMPHWSGTSSPDFDLYVQNPDGSALGESTGTSRQEQVAKRPTQTGTYKVVVHSYAGSGEYIVDVSGGLGNGQDEPPAVDIAEPEEGATVSGTVTVKVEAADDIAISKVEVAVDGGSYVDITGNREGSYYTYQWDTAAHGNDEHTLTARVTDSASQQTLSTRTVVVDNGSVPPGDQVHELIRTGQVSASARDANLDVYVHEAGYVDLALAWGTAADLDFFVYAPDGTYIGRAYTLNNPERLRIDTARWGAGRYRVRVNLYKGPDTAFTFTAKGYRMDTFTGHVSSGSRDWIQDRFMDYAGLGRVTLSWPGSSDIDFFVYDPIGRERARAYTLNNPEVADVTIDTTGYWRVRVNLYSGSGGSFTLRMFVPEAVLS